MRVKTLQELADAGKLSGKRVLIRSDLNAPHDESGRITDETRLTASVPAIQMALKAGAAVMVVSHLGRPKEGVPTEAESLIHVADRLSELLGTEMPLVRDWVDGVTVEPGHVVMLENCRFNVGEKKNNEDLARKYAALCDVYVNDAFGTSHRAEATTEGVAHFAKCACAGPLLAREIEALTAAVEEGAKAAGADVEIMEVADADVDKALSFDVLALGCPAMGDEELEEGEFEPFFSELEGKLSGKKVALFGSYDWGDGEWMRTWCGRAKDAGAELVEDEGLIVNNTPDDEGLAACRELGGKLA